MPNPKNPPHFDPQNLHDMMQNPQEYAQQNPLPPELQNLNNPAAYQNTPLPGPQVTVPLPPDQQQQLPSLHPLQQQQTRSVEDRLAHVEPELRDTLRGMGVSDEQIAAALGPNDLAATARAVAASQEREVQERQAILEGMQILSERRQRAQLGLVREAMKNPGNKYFLPNCPTGNSSEVCPLYKAYGFRVHYFWANWSDRDGFGELLAGGTGMPAF